MTEPYRAPAGWYPQGDVYRYWNGSTWTSDTAPITAPLSEPVDGAAPGPTRQPSPSYDHLPVAPPVQQSYPQPLGMVHTPSGLVPAVAVAPKSPGLSLLASFFIPGLGSMINGEVGKGVGILIGYIISWVLTIVVIGIAGVLAFWIWGMVDGYQGAQRWNARYGILS